MGVACACGGSSGEVDLTVRIDKVAPSCGGSADTTQLTVTGNMPEKPLVSVVDPNGNPVPIAYRAWMGTSELRDVKWVDRQTLTAVVPPMAAGMYPLMLQGPLGDPATKEGAFRVSDAACPVQTAALVITSAIAAPATVVVGESVTVTASVKNLGLAAAKGVTASVTSAPAGLTAPAAGPRPQDVEAGEARTFAWTYTASAMSGGAFTVEAGGTAADTSQPVAAQPVSTNEVLLNPRSFISCTSVVTPARANVGQVVTVALEVTNHATDTARVTPAMTISGPVTLVSEPAASSLAGGSSATFRWTYNAAGAGTATFTASASGTDSATGEQVTVSTAQASVTLQAPAALAATLQISPATVAGSQSGTVTASMIVRNTGGATATGVTASIVSAPTGATPPETGPASQDVPGGESRTFNWVYTIGASPGGTFSAGARGTDANSQQAVSSAQVTSGALVVTYTVGATVAGLTGTGLVLRNGDDSLAVSTNATVRFPTAVASGASYGVTVGQQPIGQTCTVSSGTGTIDTANVTASVSCAANTYRLSTTIAPSGAGNVSCNGAACKTSYGYSTTPITITATPTSGYSFSGWSGDCSGTGTCTVTMTANHAVTANFTANSYTLSTGVSPSGSGSVSCDGAACTTSYRYSTTPITITATPASGYSFSGWSGDCSGTGTCTVAMTTNRAVTANFTSP
jgi:uncharacterized repeat protein (TIGR02543 family)